LKKQVSIKDILDFKPCVAYPEKKIKEIFQRENWGEYVTVEELFKLKISSLDFFWLILRPEFISEKGLELISLWCIETIILPMYEEFFPNNKNPREAVETKKLHVKGEITIEQLNSTCYYTWSDAWRSTKPHRASDAAVDADTAATMVVSSGKMDEETIGTKIKQYIQDVINSNENEGEII